jgi:hypothetical protein
MCLASRVFLVFVLAVGAFAEQAAAQIPSAGGVFYACVRIDRDGDEGRLARLIAANEACRRNETRIHWSEKGPQGLPGVPGTNGTNGANGTNGTNGIDGTSVTFVGYFSGSAHGCPNGGAVYSVGNVATYVCNGTNGGGAALLTQQDAVRGFDLATGVGFQSGTATGQISGTTFVTFHFIVSGPPVGDVLPITFSNKVILTDLDGDQIFFDNNGTGSFHLGVPGAPFLGTGGPLVGTYVVTGGTGKYQARSVGTTYSYRAVWTNPPTPSAGFGNVYVEVH